jgi:hypothetical protein
MSGKCRGAIAQGNSRAAEKMGETCYHVDSLVQTLGKMRSMVQGAISDVQELQEKEKQKEEEEKQKEEEEKKKQTTAISRKRTHFGSSIQNGKTTSATSDVEWSEFSLRQLQKKSGLDGRTFSVARPLAVLIDLLEARFTSPNLEQYRDENRALLSRYSCQKKEKHKELAEKILREIFVYHIVTKRDYKANSSDEDNENAEQINDEDSERSLDTSDDENGTDDSYTQSEDIKDGEDEENSKEGDDKEEDRICIVSSFALGLPARISSKFTSASRSSLTFGQDREKLEDNESDEDEGKHEESEDEGKHEASEDKHEASEDEGKHEASEDDKDFDSDDMDFL